MAAEQLALTVLMGALLVGIAAFLARMENWRTYTPLASGDAAGAAGHGHKPSGITRWLTTVDHKDIGILYGTYGVTAFLWGGVAVLLMRVELMTPTSNLIQPSLYNALLTSHGITMLFLFGTPIIAAFANYFVPLLTGADDMAFPRINAIAFWLLPPGALLIWAGFFTIPLPIEIGPAETSWTMYAPLSVEQSNPSIIRSTPRLGCSTDSGAYIVQEVSAGAISIGSGIAKKPLQMSSAPGGRSQKAMALMRGNAMSSAPMSSGTK